MGPDEAATATTGGPRVINVFDGDGSPSALVPRRAPDRLEIYTMSLISPLSKGRSAAVHIPHPEGIGSSEWLPHSTLRLSASKKDGTAKGGG